MGRPLRVAVVGAGPAGVYTADALVRSGTPVSIDVLDRLPTPYGLVRYGVAPDHPKTRSIADTLRRTLEHPAVRFLGNVTHGVDVHLADLKAHYDVVVYATGADDNRRLGVPGEDLPGSCSATELVAWYNAHPSVVRPPCGVLAAKAVAVVGAGNVALDVARVLVAGADRLGDSEVPDRVLADLRRRAVTDVHVVARRGPAQVKFTVPELREIGTLEDVDVIVDPAALADVPAPADRRTRANVALLHEWSQRPRGHARRRIHFAFWRRPVAVVGSDAVEALHFADARPLPVQAVVRAIGYRGRPIPGLPFDEVAGILPNRMGSVVDHTGVAVPAVYVAGWLKRGPTGVIGSNKSDAAETVRQLLADGPALTATEPEPDAVTDLLDARGVQYVTWADWQRLDAYEVGLGRARGRSRVQTDGLATMLLVCRPQTPSRHTRVGSRRPAATSRTSGENP
jgi:ferredoxin--NADP+ reductase